MGTFQEHNASISVIVPTLDAADELSHALAPLAGSRLIHEIIASDLFLNK